MNQIAINAQSILNQRKTGVGRYVHHLIDSLLSVDQENQYWLYAKRGLFQYKKKIRGFSASNVQAVYDYFKKGPEKVLAKADLYHAPSFDMIQPMRSKVVVTVHDLVCRAFPEGHTHCWATTRKPLKCSRWF